jgi:hypothetical protein
VSTPPKAVRSAAAGCLSYQESTGLTDTGSGLPGSEIKAAEIMGAPNAFGYSGGFGMPGTYGIGQAGVPLYGTTPMLRARGGKASSDAAYVHALQRMLANKRFYQAARAPRVR